MTLGAIGGTLGGIGGVLTGTGPAPGSLEALIWETSPYNYWRLGETSGVTANDETGAADATYLNAPTLGAAGVPGDSDTAVTLNGTTHSLATGRLADLENAIKTGISIDAVFHFKTTSTALQGLLGTVSTGSAIVTVALNAQGSVNNAGWIEVRVRNNAAANQTFSAFVGADIYDGNWHQLRVRFNTGTRMHRFWFDGTKYAATSAGSAIGTVTFDQDWGIGARNLRGVHDWRFVGTLDEVFVCPPMTLAQAEALRLKALEAADPTIAMSTPTLFLSNTDIAGGWDSVYWTRPYPNPVAVGGGDEYLWLGSTDHINHGLYRGYSASPDTPPTAWTTFLVNRETPSFVYDPTEARPYRIYHHGFGSDTGGSQATDLQSYSSDWSATADEGEMLPADENTKPLLLDHTGYATMERRGAGDWHGWSFVRGAGGAAGRSEYGYWTSADGEVWTCVNDDLDVRSMVGTARQLVVRSLNRFTVGATTYAIITEHPDAISTGGRNADPAGQLVLCEMVDEETFSAPIARLWEPPDSGLTDDLRDVRAYQDDNDPTLIHLYIHNALTKVYYAALTVPA